MTCEEAAVLLHALIDGELDAGHAREVEAHVATCAGCAARLRELQELSGAMASSRLRIAAPGELRTRIEGKLPVPRATASRRGVIGGFAAGAGVSALAASGLLLLVTQRNDRQRILGEVVSAHLRSLQAKHLIDVESSDQHTVKPWFNGRLDLAPPVVDLTAQGFTLLGGRLDTLDAKPVAVIVYRRRVHVINLFCAPAPGAANSVPTMESLHGYNVLRWSENGLNLWAVSDLNAEELSEFGDKFETAMKQ